VLRRWRTLADGYDPERVLVGETWVELDELASFYGTKNDELHLAFNFAFVFAG
jgi:alpha-glucosidase